MVFWRINFWKFNLDICKTDMNELIIIQKIQSFTGKGQNPWKFACTSKRSFILFAPQESACHTAYWALHHKRNFINNLRLPFAHIGKRGAFASLSLRQIFQRQIIQYAKEFWSGVPSAVTSIGMVPPHAGSGGISLI